MRVFILACLVAAATAIAPLHKAQERIPGKYLVALKVRYKRLAGLTK